MQRAPISRPASLGLALAATSACFLWLIHCSSKGPARTLGPPTLHRVAAQACSTDRPPSVTHDGGFNPNNPYATCHKDAECTQGRNGRCEGVFNSAACACDYGQCTTDSECNGGACICRTARYGGPTYCAAKGNCLTDADCGSGGYCSPSRVGDTCNDANIAYYCHTSDDECANDADCDAFPSAGFCLVPAGQTHWQCVPFPSCDGGIPALCQ